MWLDSDRLSGRRRRRLGNRFAADGVADLVADGGAGSLLVGAVGGGVTGAGFGAIGVVLAASVTLGDADTCAEAAG